MSIFTGSELAYLAEQKLGRLATKAPGGTLQNNPVGYFVNAAEGYIDIGGHGMGASRKFHPERILSWGLPESSTRNVT
jgi:pyridoxamine 5'-phosphate oxidase family protein